MAIKRNRVVAALSGPVPPFAAFVNQLPAALWNCLAGRQTDVSGSLSERAEHLLVNASQECGYHTGHRIAASEGKAEPAPEDLLRGAFAVLKAWGWADGEIVELVPRERLVVRARFYYESGAGIYGASPKPCAYMLCGISAAFMDLAYGGPYDVTGRTGLGTFRGVQTKGIECGDEHGEFVVTRGLA
jgi:hypothetical protein